MGCLRLRALTPTQLERRPFAASLSEVNIDEALKSQPMVMPAAAPTAPTPKAEEKPAEEKKKKEEKEKEAEKAIEGLGALFG